MKVKKQHNGSGFPYFAQIIIRNNLKSNILKVFEEVFFLFWCNKITEELL